jgi:hypothetical protein
MSVKGAFRVPRVAGTGYFLRREWTITAPRGLEPTACHRSELAGSNSTGQREVGQLYSFRLKGSAELA